MYQDNLNSIHSTEYCFNQADEASSGFEAFDLSGIALQEEYQRTVDLEAIKAFLKQERAFERRLKEFLKQERAFERGLKKFLADEVVIEDELVCRKIIAIEKGKLSAFLINFSVEEELAYRKAMAKAKRAFKRFAEKEKAILKKSQLGKHGNCDGNFKQENIYRRKGKLYVKDGKKEFRQEDLQPSIKSERHQELSFERQHTLKDILHICEDGIKNKLKPLTYCGQSPIFNKEMAIEIGKNGRARFVGLMTCKNPYCPVCGVRRAFEKRDEIALALHNAEQSGYKAYFLTLTMQHTIEEDLKDLAKDLNKNKAQLFKLNIIKELCDVGSIKSIEVTHSFNNGFHPHLHIVLFSSIDVPLEDIQAYEDDIFSEWQRICLKNQKKRVSKEHGVKLIKIDDQKMRNNVSKYITISNFTEDNITYKEGMSEEASLGVLKLGRGENKTVFQYLDEYKEIKEALEVGKEALGEDVYRDLYSRSRKVLNVIKTFYSSIKSIASMRFSDGLKKTLKVPSEIKDVREELSELGLLKELHALGKEDFDEMDKRKSKGVREEGFRVRLSEREMKSLDYFSFKNEMLRMVENINFTIDDFAYLKKSLSALYAIGGYKDRKAVIKFLKLYYRRCTSESKMLDMEQMIINYNETSEIKVDLEKYRNGLKKKFDYYGGELF